jgi:hypothetical protein
LVVLFITVQVRGAESLFVPGEGFANAALDQESGASATLIWVVTDCGYRCSRVLLVNPARIAYSECRDVTPPYLKWIEERFPKSAQALFSEFLPPLIIAYSP